MHRTRPLRESHRQHLGNDFRIELTEQANHFRRFIGWRRLQSFHKLMHRFVAETVYDFREQFAVFAKSRMPEPIGYVVERGLRHQRQNVRQSVRNLPRAQRLFPTNSGMRSSAPMRGRKFCDEPGRCASTLSSDASACCMAG